MPWRNVLSIMAMAVAPHAALAQGAADPLAPGTLPIVPCSAGANQGCVEFLFQGADAPVPCWELPPFDEAGVRIEVTAPSTVVAGTRRVTIRFAPLDAVPAGRAVALAFGVAAPGQPLACNRVVTVERRPSTLAVGNAALGDIQVEFFGLLRSAEVSLPVFPAAGQPPVGPLAATPGRLLLHNQDRRGAPLALSAGIAGAPVISANRPGELRLVPDRRGRWFPALGALAAPLWLTAPQLVAPHEMRVEARARIGWVTILLALAAGIGAGWYARMNLAGRQQMTGARLRAERAAFAAGRARDHERDGRLIADLARLIADLRRDAAEAEDEKAIDEAVARFESSWRERLARAAADRTALAEEIAPARTALAVLPAGSELPPGPLKAWRGLLDEAQELLEAGEVERVRHLLDEAGTAAVAAGLALADHARRARQGLAALGAWQPAGAAEAFGPLAALAPQFELAPDAEPLAALSQLDQADRALRAAAQDQAPAIGAIVQPLAARTRLAEAPAEARAILARLATRPVQALGDLEDFRARMEAAGYKAVEASTLETATVVPPVPAPVPPPAVPGLALVTDPPLPLAGRDFRIALSGLPEGMTAHIQTPAEAERLDADRPGPTASLRIARPGRLAVEVLLRDRDGKALPVQRLALQVSPDPDRLRLDSRATAARRVGVESTVVAAGLAALTGAALFSELPLTSWWALLGPFLWGFFVNLNLADAIETLRGRRDALLPAPGAPPAPGAGG